MTPDNNFLHIQISKIIINIEQLSDESSGSGQGVYHYFVIFESSQLISSP